MTVTHSTSSSLVKTYEKYRSICPTPTSSCSAMVGRGGRGGAGLVTGGWPPGTSRVMSGLVWALHPPRPLQSWDMNGRAWAVGSCRLGRHPGPPQPVPLTSVQPCGPARACYGRLRWGRPALHAVPSRPSDGAAPLPVPAVAYLCHQCPGNISAPLLLPHSWLSSLPCCRLFVCPKLWKGRPSVTEYTCPALASCARPLP